MKGLFIEKSKHCQGLWLNGVAQGEQQKRIEPSQNAHKNQVLQAWWAVISIILVLGVSVCLFAFFFFFFEKLELGRQGSKQLNKKTILMINTGLQIHCDKLGARKKDSLKQSGRCKSSK